MLIRLGTVTHAFNYDQRIITMNVDGSPTATVTWPENTASQCRPALGVPENPTSPSQCSIAPPGNYMLFALRQGVPSEAIYIRVGDSTTVSFLCQGGAGLEVTETSCAAEPAGGSCPSLASVSTAVPLPTVPNATGQPTAGWQVVANPGMVGSPSSPTATDLAIIEATCMQACEQEWSDNPNVVATCSAPGAFANPVLLLQPP